MTGDHAELTAELRALAETVLERLEPILQKVAAPMPDAEAGGAGDDRPTCSTCTWCPLCALAALIRGEQHDLVTLVAGQASTLLAALREALDAHDTAGGEARATAATTPASAPPSAFVPIDVRITEPEPR
ncbi:hypothetical protein [Rhodococcus sp. ACT016]|uniref:hypothetical protein n=1 Tax=Rhodococcus sp. ACT016 TaxID=3134808 RepID=UPI003D2C0920